LFAFVLRLRPGFIVASGDCFVGLIALAMARVCDAKLVFDVYDDYRTFGGYRVFMGFKAFEFLLKRADLVFYASTPLARLHTQRTPFAIVPNGVDPTVFTPMAESKARHESGLAGTDTQWIGYFGGLDPERGAKDLVEAVRQIHERDPSVRLLLCGNGNPADFAQPWVDYLGVVEHGRIPALINSCAVVALPYRRGPAIDMASSCKIAEYLFCGRPIVATRSPNFLENFPVQSAQLGDALCEPGNPADLARAIGYQLEHRLVAAPPGEHAWSRIADRALSAMREID
jgi:glycosyltransferase involved in cell wall biosynthesis